MAKKKISRIRDSEIKKQLRNFAKKEFNEKKPLEIRVLRLKPKVVFKKGTMLPNLVIKKLEGTAYIIYVDYQEQLKIYYYDMNGMSLGSSNFDKSEKILKEMHGKAKTLLKLPKVEHVIGLDEENKRIRERWERLATQYSHKFGILVKNLPAISIGKNIPKHNIRIGIKQDKDVLHFDHDYYGTDLQDIILLKELFPILTNTPANKETVQMISTIWALVFTDSKKYIQVLNKIMIKKSVNKKAIRWIQAIFLPYLKDNPEKKEEIAKFLLRTCMIIRGNDLFVFYEFFDLILLWLMKFGIKRYFQFFDYTTHITGKSWLFFEILEFYYIESILCKNYGIKRYNDQTLLLIHLCSQIILEKDSRVNEQLIKKIIPNYSQMENALTNLEFSRFLSLISEPLIIKNAKFLTEILLAMLATKGIIVETKDIIELHMNTEKNIDILINNRTDWNLEDVHFQTDFKPPNRIELQDINPERLEVLEGVLKLNIKFKSTSKAGKCRLSVKMSFRNPINSEISESILIRNIEINIQ